MIHEKADVSSFELSFDNNDEIEYAATAWLLKFQNCQESI